MYGMQEAEVRNGGMCEVGGERGSHTVPLENEAVGASVQNEHVRRVERQRRKTNLLTISKKKIINT
jgi:hypothetical protein